MNDLLGNVVVIPANEGKKMPSSINKATSLLDDTNNNDEEFSDFVSANVQEVP